MTAPTLKDRITEDMKAAMRAREADRLGAIRMLLAAIKQRRDSIAAFEQAGRTDLVERERAEVDVLSVYLPAQASEEEVAAEVDAAIAATGAGGPQDMGKVMGVLKPRLAGRTDLSKVSGIVKARLAQR